MGKDLEIGVPSIPDLQLGDPGEKGLTNMAGSNKDKLPELKLKKPNGELKNQAVDLIAVATNCNTDPQTESVVFDTPGSISKLLDMKDKTECENKEMPSLELSLKRLRDIRDTGSSDRDRNVLRHSGFSAFSRYRGG